MDENAIKIGVLTRIRRAAKGRLLPVVTSEFSLNGTGIRADLAVLDGDCFYGIEIKSAADTLKRLPSQMEGYARYFDRTELVVAPKHLRGLRDIDLRGAWVWRCEVLTDWQLHSFGEDRRTSGQWLLSLLPQDSERRALRMIEQRLSNGSLVDVDTMRREQFYAEYRRRYSLTSTAFWEAVRGRRIMLDDLPLLSRFHAVRQREREAAERSDAFWDSWVTALRTNSSSL